MPTKAGTKSPSARFFARINTHTKISSIVRSHRLLPKPLNAGVAATDAQRGAAPVGTSLAWRRKVLFIGLFPPPIDGQRLVTQRMFERLDAATTVVRHDLDRFPRMGRLSKPLSALAACFVLMGARLRGCSTLYLAPHSGTGLLYSCAIVLAGRLFGYSLSIHYHSYRNMARRSRLMAAFIAICGREATHIVLGPPMAQDLRRLYGHAERISVVSNAVFIAPHEEPHRAPGGRLRLGHLSNLSRQKGIAGVLGCMRDVLAQGVDAELHLAGPAADAQTRALIAGAQAEFGDRLVYLGRLDADGVRRFYSGIDVFLFPTIHEHEAEPLVIVDAVAAGVPVLATDRGCIGYLLNGQAGFVFGAAEFIERAAACIARWARDPQRLAYASKRAAARFRELHDTSRRQLDHLIDAMLDDPHPSGPSCAADEPRRVSPRV